MNAFYTYVGFTINAYAAFEVLYNRVLFRDAQVTAFLAGFVGIALS